MTMKEIFTSQIQESMESKKAYAPEKRPILPPSYVLREGVYLVQGVKNAAIYDTNTGNVFSINEAAKKTIIEKPDREDVFLNELLSLSLISLEMPKKIEISEKKPELEFVWFEITENCNQECIHCYADCESEKVLEKKHKKEMISADKWKDMISECHSLGADECQFIGGEPFVWRGENNENVVDLAEYAMKVGYSSVEIFTNGILLSKEDALRIKESEINIAVSLYSSDERIHDAITGKHGSLKKLLKTLELLRKFNINTRVEILAMRQNQFSLDTTIDFIKSLGFINTSIGLVRPTGKGSSLLVVPETETYKKYGLMMSPNFNADEKFIKRSMISNNCLAGKIVIQKNGDVIPCVFLRNEVVGNINNESLEKILKTPKIREMWNITKDNVQICSDCEYRYICKDCRALSKSVYSKDNFPFPRCTYNPYLGEWGGGLWRKDNNGKLYFEEKYYKQ